jgi:hypothetical protein
MKRPGVTRRQMTAAVLASPAIAQTPPAKPADELEAARAQVRKRSEALRAFKVPQLLEPSFTFRP